MTQTTERLERLGVTTLHHVPPRRLGTEEDLRRDEQRGDAGLYVNPSASDGGRQVSRVAYAAKHEPPVESADAAPIGDVLEGEVHDVAHHDTERSPRLPHHDERATNERGRAPVAHT